MTIVDELKALILKRGGEVTNVQTVSDAVKVITSLESEVTEESEGSDEG